MISTILYVMIPSFEDVVTANELPILEGSIVWFHAVIGAITIVLALIIIVSWVAHPLGELGCSKRWRLMMPTFILWFVSLILGIVIHIIM